MSDKLVSLNGLNEIYEFNQFKKIRAFLELCINSAERIFENNILIIEDSYGSELNEFMEIIKSQTNANYLEIDFFKSFMEYIKNYNEEYKEEGGISAEEAYKMEYFNKIDFFLNFDNFNQEGIGNIDGEEKSSDINENSKKNSKDNISKIGNNNIEENEKESNIEKNKDIPKKDNIEKREANKSAEKDHYNKESNNLDIQSKIWEKNKPKVLILKNLALFNKVILEVFENIIRLYEQYIREYYSGLRLTPYVLVIIKNEDDRLPLEIIEKADLIEKIGYPLKIERITIMESIFNKLNIHYIDISALSELVEGWNVKDIKRLIKVAYMKWKILNYLEFKKDENKISENIKESKSNIEDKAKSNIEDKAESNIEDKAESNIEDKAESNIKDKAIEGNKVNLVENKKLSEEKATEEILNDKNEDNKEESQSKQMNNKFTLSKLRKKYKVPFNLEIFKEIINNKEVKPAREEISFELMKYQLNYMDKCGTSPLGDPLFNQFYYMTSIQQPNILNKEFINYRSDNEENVQIKPEFKKEKAMFNLISGNIADITSFTTSQLYQFAAANDYEDLLLVLEKLDSGKMLNESDRKQLAKYPFVLLDKPQTAMSRLINANVKVTKIKKLFKSKV
ncbi:MAG: hypothetical protein ACTSRZ_05905 [Promethearchaeota archaeon]